MLSTGGKWPFWLNPRQVVVVPVSEKTLDYAERVYKAIFAAGFYVDLDTNDEQLRKKLQWVKSNNTISFLSLARYTYTHHSSLPLFAMISHTMWSTKLNRMKLLRVQ